MRQVQVLFFYVSVKSRQNNFTKKTFYFIACIFYIKYVQGTWTWTKGSSLTVYYIRLCNLYVVVVVTFQSSPSIQYKWIEYDNETFMVSFIFVIDRCTSWENRFSIFKKNQNLVFSDNYLFNRMNVSFLGFLI